MRHDTTHEGARDGREALRGSGDGGSFLVDGRGTIVGFDGGMEQLTGWTAADVVGRSASVPILLAGPFIPTPGHDVAEIALLARDGSVLDVEASLGRSEGAGDRTTVSVVRVIARNQGGRVAPTAGYDPLTGLATRESFLERLGVEMREAGANGRPLALVVADVVDATPYGQHRGREAARDRASEACGGSSRPPSGGRSVRGLRTTICRHSQRAGRGARAGCCAPRVDHRALPIPSTLGRRQSRSSSPEPRRRVLPDRRRQRDRLLSAPEALDQNALAGTQPCLVLRAPAARPVRLRCTSGVVAPPLVPQRPLSLGLFVATLAPSASACGAHSRFRFLRGVNPDQPRVPHGPHPRGAASARTGDGRRVRAIRRRGPARSGVSPQNRGNAEAEGPAFSV
jgi:hypothetical protein